MSSASAAQPASRLHARTGRTVPHLGFVAAEVLVLLALGALSLGAHNHPGPFTGDVRIERDVQNVFLPHSFLRGPIEALSTLNWPVPTAITLAIIVVLFLLLRRWLDAILIPVAAGAESLSTFVLSKWVHRPRPSGHGIHILQKITSTFSYPSGHVAYAAAIFGLFLFLTTQVRRPIHPALIWGIRILLVLLIVGMPFSRITEGEHWPSDVLAGLFDGLFWLVLFAHLYWWLRARFPVLLAADER